MKILEQLFQQANHLRVFDNRLQALCDEAGTSMDAWLEGLKNNESEQFAQYPFFPTDYECARLSLAAYEPRSTERLPVGWECLRVAINEKDGYVGVAYWHAIHRHLVIAHQGTDNIQDVWADMNAIMKGNIDPQMASATKFTIDTVEKIAGLALSVTITGHSLGGWLAQITAYHLAELGDVHPHAVVFESPGCSEMLTKLLLERDRNLTLEDLDITIYLSAPNYVNTCGKHPASATLYRVPTRELPWDGWSAKGYIEHFRSVHSMSHLCEAFNSETGYPNTRYRMLSWPSTQFPQGEMSRWKPVALLGRVREFVFSKNDSELQEFLSFAKALWDLSLKNQSSLPFDAQYQLTYSAGYRRAPDNEPPVLYKVTVFPKKLRDFLETYLNFKSYCTTPTAKFLLQANHERYQQQGYTQIHDLLDKYEFENDCIGGQLDPVAFVRYLLHVVRLSPDVAILKSSALEQIMTELELIKQQQSATIPQGSIANRVGEVYIGHLFKTNLQINKDTPYEFFKELVPIVKDLTSGGGMKLEDVARPALFGEVKCLRILQAFDENVIIGSRPTVPMDQQAFNRMLETTHERSTEKGPAPLVFSTLPTASNSQGQNGTDRDLMPEETTPGESRSPTTLANP